MSKLLILLLGCLALQTSAVADSCKAGQAACGEDAIEAAEMEEAEAMKTELLQMSVSSAASFNEPDNTQVLGSIDAATVEIDDMADMPTMLLLQTDIEVSSPENKENLS
eukprot:TRINITY_DN3284_c0_g2_i1.p2 TRINITY_DN3284_c0_g2~~TRINITY_DN3284_c0_g2_i1.p2  ORF type:complete len:109 (-),score=37.83 TRINITY_DN3284_c0_g2_i1:139-465(-)